MFGTSDNGVVYQHALEVGVKLNAAGARMSRGRRGNARARALRIQVQQTALSNEEWGTRMQRAPGPNVAPRAQQVYGEKEKAKRLQRTGVFNARAEKAKDVRAIYAARRICAAAERHSRLSRH